MAYPLNPKCNPKASTPVSVIQRYTDRIAVKKAVTASTDLATFLGSAILDTDAEVRIISDGTLQYNPVGAASAASAFLPADYTISGGKPKLDLVQIFAGASINVSIIVKEVYGA